MAPVKRILFVDDEVRVLEALERMLYSLRKEWQMVFVSNGRDALRLLSDSPFDVLVTDMRMPGMTGAELLANVIESHPQVVRIILSGTGDQAVTLRSVKLAHQYLSKPCDARVLRAAVERAMSLKTILEDSELKRLVASIQSLPSVPAVYLKVVDTLRYPDTSAGDIGRLIAQDPSMTAKILQLVNSAFFGVSRSISDPSQAVVYLGVETVRSLVLTVSVFSQFDRKTTPGFMIEDLRDHCVSVATLARQIARSMSLPKAAVDDAFTGGLMHDLGKLILASNFPARYQEVLQQDDSYSADEAEAKIFGATHGAIGAYLLWVWGLPESVTEVVARHHLEAPQNETPGPTLAVYLANLLIRRGTLLDGLRGHLERLDLIEHFSEWQRKAEELLSGDKRNVEADFVCRRRA
jgi:putative nucleotidyltransferase with HDIG domain